MVHMQVRLVEEERKLLMTMLQEQPQDLPESAVDEASTLASTATGAQSRLLRSVSDGTVLPGSLRAQFTDTLPRPEPQHAKRLQPSQSDAGSSQGVGSSQKPVSDTADRQLADTAIRAEVDVKAEVRPEAEVENAVVHEGLADSIQAVQPQKHLQQISRGMSAMPFSSSQHAQRQSIAGMVARRKDNLYNEQKAYWHRKEALCPNIKYCIQEVQQLRAQLSMESASLFPGNTA